MIKTQVIGASVRLGGLRPKKGRNGGVAARYQEADNTMGVGFIDPSRRIKAISFQKVEVREEIGNGGKIEKADLKTGRKSVSWTGTGTGGPVPFRGGPRLRESSSRPP